MITALHESELIVALITPFKEDESIDHEALANLADKLANEGCDGLLVNGTTGEGPTLSLEETISTIKTVLPITKKHGLPLMTGAGSNCTRTVVEKVKALEATGVDGILAVVPYYNRPSQAGLFKHFSHIAEATHCPIMLYNIPSRCGVNLEAETMARLHQAYPNIIGVKQSNADLDKLNEIKRHCSESFRVWSGDDSLTLPMLALGAQGVVSVTAHLAAPGFKRMINLFKAGEVQQAQAVQQELYPLMDELFTEPNPTVVKRKLAELGYCQPVYRSPF